MMDHKRPDYSKLREGPGENGKAVEVSDNEKAEESEQMKKWYMNVVASNKISVERRLMDARSRDCKNVTYNMRQIPSVSVIITFTGQLKEPLDKHIERFGGLVRVFRRAERLGPIHAKNEAARVAQGRIVVFLDAHCEVNTGWLEPLADRIRANKSAIAVPTIDDINAETLAYTVPTSLPSIGGFSWSLDFQFEPIPQHLVSRRNKTSETIRFVSVVCLSFSIPILYQGIFAVARNGFLDRGGFHPKIYNWEDSLIELSFKFWQCGGLIEYVPCSHIGHVTRRSRPYSMSGFEDDKDTRDLNRKRIAEIWLDEYSRFFYQERPDLKGKDIGDVSRSKGQRLSLNCTPFTNYLDNVLPQKFIPDENGEATGALENIINGYKLCADTLQRKEKEGNPVGIFACQSKGSAYQTFTFTKEGHLRRKESCTKVGASDGSKTVVLVACPEEKDIEKWKYEWGLLKHQPTGLCLTTTNLKGGDNLRVVECDPANQHQIWKFTKH